MKKLSEIGELGLVGLFKTRMKSRHPSVVLGIGDDTAVLKGFGKKNLLFTTDMLIEGRHFRFGEASPFEIGRKAVAVNLSDIAAMGGDPTHAVVALGLPSSLPAAFVLEVMRGVHETAKRFGACVVGGDTNRSDRLVVSVAMIGRARGAPIRRSGAKVGDVIFVTGELGGSYASRKHLDFIPRLREAHYLTGHFKVRAMIDLSDGLASDLGRLATESRVGAFIAKEAIPLSKHARGTASALNDGEDFELLFTLSLKEAKRLMAKTPPRGLAAIRPIGRIMGRHFGIKLLRVEGRWEVLSQTGFDHFRCNL